MTDSGARGRAAVPSGASTGSREAVELRDGDPSRWHGRGVSRAVAGVNDVIGPGVRGMDVHDQRGVDSVLTTLDGTPDKSRLGANALLGVSLAVARAAATENGNPLFRDLADPGASLLPVPMMNVINGGAHADNALDFQEFMIVPVGSRTFHDAVRHGSEVFHSLKKLLGAMGHSTNVGDEGGFAPALSDPRAALDLIVEAIDRTGLRPGDDVAIALDPAASEFYDGHQYVYEGTGQRLTPAEQAGFLEQLVDEYPILSLEDPVAEDDLEGWRSLTSALRDRCQLVGDDVFCTNQELLKQGVADGVANAILLKVNQIGTLTEALDTAAVARGARYGVVMSHRSGETEDTTIADLAVGIECGQIKTGSLSRSDRTAKYNRLLRIEEMLGSRARYAGTSAYTSGGRQVSS